MASGNKHIEPDMTSSKTFSRSASEEKPPPAAAEARGRVQRIYPERGFGFIRCTEGGEVGQDYFFHYSGLDDCPITDLEEGSIVLFEPRQVAKGRRAEHIRSGS